MSISLIDKAREVSDELYESRELLREMLSTGELTSEQVMITKDVIRKLTKAESLLGVMDN